MPAKDFSRAGVAVKLKGCYCLGFLKWLYPSMTAKATMVTSESFRANARTATHTRREPNLSSARLARPNPRSGRNMGESLWVCEWTKKSTQDCDVRGAAFWGQLRRARCAYDVVSFSPTQTSSTRLVVFGKEKAPVAVNQRRFMGLVFG